MFYRESTLRELATAEATKLLRSSTGRDAVAQHLPSALADPVIKGVVLGLLVELLASERAVPLAEQVTSEVQVMLDRLEAQVERAIKLAQTRITKQKGEILEKAKEELRLAMIAQKSLSTRQVNQLTSHQQDVFQTLLAQMNRQMEEAQAEAELRIARYGERLARDLRGLLDAVFDERLEEVASQAVKEHVRSKPIFRPRYSNRELAAMNGISIREVKRRRLMS